MTIHIIGRSDRAAIVASDSQISYHDVELHGAQKQLAGHNFLLAAAGPSEPIAKLFAELDAEREPSLDAVRGRVRTLVNMRLRPEVASQLVFVLVSTQQDASILVEEFDGGIFTDWEPQVKQRIAIGSGARIVGEAALRRHAMGMEPPLEHIEDLWLDVHWLAMEADSCLTVDSKLLFAVLYEGRCYQLGHQDVRLRHGHPTVVARWLTAATRFRTISASTRSLAAELRALHRISSRLGHSSAPAGILQSLGVTADAVTEARQHLRHELVDYFAWYDQVLSEVDQPEADQSTAE